MEDHVNQARAELTWWTDLEAAYRKSGYQPTQDLVAATLGTPEQIARGALAADDALKRQGMEIRFRVRETPEWRLHAAELETEMLRRGMMFEVIDWSKDQTALPFEG